MHGLSGAGRWMPPFTQKGISLSAESLSEFSGLTIIHRLKADHPMGKWQF